MMTVTVVLACRRHLAVHSTLQLRPIIMPIVAAGALRIVRVSAVVDVHLQRLAADRCVYGVASA